MRVNSALPTGLSRVAANLSPIAVAGSGKLALRAEGLSSLYILLRVAAEDPSTAEALKTNKVWDSVAAYFEPATMIL